MHLLWKRGTVHPVMETETLCTVKGLCVSPLGVEIVPLSVEWLCETIQKPTRLPEKSRHPLVEKEHKGNTGNPNKPPAMANGQTSHIQYNHRP